MEGSMQNERTRPAEVVRTEARALLELAIRLDGAMAAPFARAVLLVGVWPAPLLKVMQPSIHHLVTQALASKL